MSEQDNIRSVEQVFDDINTKNLGGSANLYIPDYRFEGPGAPGPITYEQSLAYIQGFVTAFPDLHFTLKDWIADGDRVAVTWVATGTHNGPLPTPSGATIPPTGKKGVVPGCTTYVFKGDKIAGAANYWDMASLLMQLGLMPGM